MENKGQVSIFMIIGLVIVITAFLIISFRNLNFEDDKLISSTINIQPIKLFVQECVRSIGTNALILIGKQGGYYEIPRPYLKDEYFDLPFYFYQNLNFAPSIKEIETEISTFINENLLFCINNFEEFRKLGFEVEYKNINTDTIAEEKGITFIVNFPITISKNNEIRKIENFNTRLNKMPIKKINNVSREIINLQLKEPNSICLSCLYDLGNKNNLYIDITEYLNNTLIFDIKAYNTTIIPKNDPYNFTFAIKYEEISCDNLAGSDDFLLLLGCIELEIAELSNEIIIEEIPNFEIKVDEEFFYEINASGKNIIFEDFTNLFEIHETTGMIEFTPGEEDMGEHIIWIKVVDSLGNEDFESFKLNIINGS